MIKSDATSITIDDKTFKLGNKVWHGLNYNKKNQVTFIEGIVCFGKFNAEIYECYGFYVGNINGKQVSEAGLTEEYIIIR